MRMEHHVLNELHSFRFTGDEPQYALVISHGLGGHGGIYDVFCEHHAAKGADIWSYDAPGHGRSTTNRPRGQWTMDEWVQASRDFAAHVKKETGLPVFTFGSSLGVAAAISARDSQDVTGVICMGSLAVPGSPVIAGVSAPWRSDEVKAVLQQLGRGGALNISNFFDFDKDYGYTGAGEQKKLDPFNTWNYDLASWATLHQYEPTEPLADNTKPILFTVGEKDPNFPAEAVKAVAGGIGGPVELEIFEGAGHQLMLFETEKFSDRVHEFCVKNI